MIEQYKKYFKEGVATDINMLNNIYSTLNKKFNAFNKKYSTKATQSSLIRVTTDQVIHFSGFNAVCQYSLNIDSLVNASSSKKAKDEFYKILNSVFIKLKFESSKPGNYVNKQANISCNVYEKYGTNYSMLGVQISNNSGKPFISKASVK